MTAWQIDNKLLAAAQKRLADLPVFWLIGGAGSGKTAISTHLAAEYGIERIDMDARIFGSYHARFDKQRHPLSSAWAAAENGLAWQLNLDWHTFDRFQRVALPEVADLLAAELAAASPSGPMLADGGLYHPDLLAELLPPERIIALDNPEQTSRGVWEGSAERLQMREIVLQLPNGEQKWETFLEFDRGITETIRTGCPAVGVRLVVRRSGEPVVQTAARVARLWGWVNC